MDEIERDIRAGIERQYHRAYRTGSLIAAGYMATVTASCVAHGFRLRYTAGAVGVTVLLMALWALLRWGALPVRAVQSSGVALVVLIALWSGWSFWWARSNLQSLDFMLLAILAGLLLRSAPAFAAGLAAVLGLWLAPFLAAPVDPWPDRSSIVLRVAAGACIGLTLHLLIRRLLESTVQARSSDRRTSEENLRLVGELQEAERQLAVQASTDPLTGLDNRRQLLAALGRELERAARHRRPLSVVLVDLDHFKEVNDTHGYAVGDCVLRNVARVLRDGVRATDLCARYGGEEFALVLPETEADSATRLADELRRCVSVTATEVEGRSLFSTASLGVVSLLHADDVVTLEQLLERADEALYRAKQGGRNRVEVWQPGA